MPRRTTEHAEAVRGRILDGARAAFATGGYRGASMPSIAREAGVSVGLIYRYFESKEELFLALCLGGTEQAYGRLGEELAGIDDAAVRLRAAFAAYVDSVAGEGAMVLNALPVADADPRIREALDGRARGLRAFSAQFLRDAVRRGELSPATDIDGQAHAISTLLDGVLVARAAEGDNLDRERLLDVLVGFVIDASGLGQPDAAHRAGRPGASRDHSAELGRVLAIIPVRDLEVAKSRLGGTLDAEERQAIVTALLGRTIAAALGACEGVIVVSPDPDVLAAARRAGAVAQRQRTTGLNPALDEGRTAAIARGATAVLVLPADLAAASEQAVRELIEAGRAALKPGRPLVVVVPDRHGVGTNALLITPPRTIPFRFGEGSCRLHLAAAETAGAVAVRLESPLGLDLDTPEDLLLADPLLAEPLLAHDHAV